MTMVTREEKLIAQMQNIEVMLTQEASAEQKVFMITQQMSYINELVNMYIEPLREEAGNSSLIQLANDTFVEFVQK